MIVEYWIDGEMRRVSTAQEVEIAIDRALSELESERAVPLGFNAGSTGAFHVFDLPEGTKVPAVAENSLIFGVNQETGYGGMVWWGEAISEDPDQFYWMSRGKNPPSFDPHVTADPGYPLWYQPCNVVPLESVEAALKEFCFTQGMRPTVVDWEPSTANGQPLGSYSG